MEDEENDISIKMNRLAEKMLPILQSEEKFIGVAVILKIMVENSTRTKEQFLKFMEQAWESFKNE